jgi:hypothetical protein
MGSANRLNTRLRQPEVFHLALLNQVFNRSSDIFDRNFVIDAMLVKTDR